MCRAGASLNEDNDCSVKALAIAARVSYAMAHKACAKHGRKPKRGMYTQDILETASHTLNCRVELKIDLRQRNGSRYTVKTIAPLLNKGHYLVFVRGHVLAVVDGKVEDWTANRRDKK